MTFILSLVDLFIAAIVLYVLYRVIDGQSKKLNTQIYWALYYAVMRLSGHCDSQGRPRGRMAVLAKANKAAILAPAKMMETATGSPIPNRRKPATLDLDTPTYKRNGLVCFYNEANDAFELRTVRNAA